MNAVEWLKKNDLRLWLDKAKVVPTRQSCEKATGEKIKAKDWMAIRECCRWWRPGLADAVRRRSPVKSDGAGARPVAIGGFGNFDELKKEYGADVLLAYHVGDFYEFIHQDAEKASRLLGLTLTSRDKGERAMPMTGFPHHQLEAYLQKLIAAGNRVAVCELA